MKLRVIKVDVIANKDENTIKNTPKINTMGIVAARCGKAPKGADVRGVLVFACKEPTSNRVYYRCIL